MQNISHPNTTNHKKNSHSTLPSLHVISALAPHLQQLASPPKRYLLQPLGIFFPFSFVSSQWLYFSTQIGKEFASGGGGAPQRFGRNTLWQDPLLASDPSMAKLTQHGTSCMTQGMTKCSHGPTTGPGMLYQFQVNGKAATSL
jgi:hypothetical protein